MVYKTISHLKKTGILVQIVDSEVGEGKVKTNLEHFVHKSRYFYLKIMGASQRHRS
jgi:hypothetical protein